MANQTLNQYFLGAYPLFKSVLKRDIFVYVLVITSMLVDEAIISYLLVELPCLLMELPRLLLESPCLVKLPRFWLELPWLLAELTFQLLELP